MERLALIGVSHRRGGAGALESWQDAFDENALAELARQGFAELVPISTCNRWDLVLRLPDGVAVDDVRRRLTPAGQTVRPYAYVGDAALEQLCRIASSLDSLNPGEDQIMRQVRASYLHARQRGWVGPTLSFVFETALRVAKRVRREVELAPLSTSLLSLARPQLERALPPGSAAAVLGAGEMGTLAAKSVHALPGVRLIIANRSFERAQQVARHLLRQSGPTAAAPAAVEALPLDAFLQRPPAVQALICTTPKRDLIDAATVRALPDLKLIVDVGIPRNVAADAAHEARQRGVDILDVDSLQRAGEARREELTEKLAIAEGIVRSELEAAVQAWTEKQLGASIRRLRAWYRQTIGEALPDADAERLASKFAHVPIKGLRAIAREHGLDAARTFLLETGLLEAGAPETAPPDSGRGT